MAVLQVELWVIVDLFNLLEKSCYDVSDLAFKTVQKRCTVCLPLRLNRWITAEIQICSDLIRCHDWNRIEEKQIFLLRELALFWFMRSANLTQLYFKHSTSYLFVNLHACHFLHLQGDINWSILKDLCIYFF